jgi:hypothetical protein
VTNKTNTYTQTTTKQGNLSRLDSNNSPGAIMPTMMGLEEIYIILIPNTINILMSNN